MKTMILAIGGAGGNIAETIRKKTKHTDLESARYVFADRDAGDLKKHEHDNGILLEVKDDVFPTGIFEGVGRLVILAGLGGMTATKCTEQAIMAAKEACLSAITVITTIPFTFEGNERVEAAITAAQHLSDIDGIHTAVYHNEDLLTKYPDLNFLSAFDAADKEIMRIVENLI